MDITGISAALGSLKTVYDLLKNANDAQLAMKVSAEIANVQARLLDAQQQALAIQEDNQALRTELEKYKTFTHHHSVMWRIRPDGKEDGPFCPACNAERVDMRLTLVPQADQSRDYWLAWCPKQHVDPRHKPQAWVGVRQEATYRVPKNLVAENYFSHAANAYGGV
jgi:hypothetical protein